MSYAAAVGKPHIGVIDHAAQIRILDVNTQCEVVRASHNHPCIYLGFLERARADQLRSLGIDQRGAIESGRGVYAVAELHIQYRRPAKLDDELVIASYVQEIRGETSVLRQKVLRGEETLAEATVTVAFISDQGRPRPQPPEWVDKLKKATLSLPRR